MEEYPGTWKDMHRPKIKNLIVHAHCALGGDLDLEGAGGHRLRLKWSTCANALEHSFEGKAEPRLRVHTYRLSSGGQWKRGRCFLCELKFLDIVCPG
jgi:hypothetical protein